MLAGWSTSVPDCDAGRAIGYVLMKNSRPKSEETVVDEVRRIRETISKEFENDVWKLGRHLQKRQRTRKTVVPPTSHTPNATPKRKPAR